MADPMKIRASMQGVAVDVKVLMNHENETKVKAVKKKVNAMMKKYPLYKG